MGRQALDARHAHHRLVYTLMETGSGGWVTAYRRGRSAYNGTLDGRRPERLLGSGARGGRGDQRFRRAGCGVACGRSGAVLQSGGSGSPCVNSVFRECKQYHAQHCSDTVETSKYLLWKNIPAKNCSDCSGPLIFDRTVEISAFSFSMQRIPTPVWFRLFAYLPSL